MKTGQNTPLPSQTTPPKDSAPQKSMRKMLIVEDEAVAALDLGEMIGELGYTNVGIVDTGEEAIEKAKQLRPALVLMDVRLKGKMDGIAAAQQIWEELQIPIVFLTSYSDEKTLGRAKLAHPYGYILKPFDQDELRTTLELAFFRIESVTQDVPSAAPKAELKKENYALVDGAKKSPITDFLHRVDPFRKLPIAELQAISKSCSFRSLDAGQIFVQEGAEDAECFIVAEGRIACVKSFHDGKELVVRLLPPGDILGVILAIDEEPFPFAVRAERDSTILTMPPEVLKGVLTRHPTLYQDFNQLMTERMTESLNLSCRLAHSRVEVRIAKALLMLLGDFGKFDRESEGHWIDITRLELAHLVGTTPETSIRVTKQMEGQGILNLSKPSRIGIINLEALEALEATAEGVN